MSTKSRVHAVTTDRDALLSNLSIRSTHCSNHYSSTLIRTEMSSGAEC
jgi:hypothetical protein